MTDSFPSFAWRSLVYSDAGQLASSLAVVLPRVQIHHGTSVLLHDLGTVNNQWIFIEELRGSITG